MMNEILGHDPLKNKDLAGAPTRSRVENTFDALPDTTQPAGSDLEEFAHTDEAYNEAYIDAELEMA
jgi:hypothetical protein